MPTDLNWKYNFFFFFKALKTTELASFPGRILPCEQNCLHYTILYTTNTNLRRWDQGLPQGT